MDLNAEIEYQKTAPELSHPVRPTTPEKFAEYATPPHPRTRPIYYLLSLIHLLKPRRIYEMGAGAGELTTRLAKTGYHVTSVELSTEVAAAAQKRAELDGVEDRVNVVVGDALEYRDPEGDFDLIIAKLVLHHLDLGQSLDAICENLAPDGTVLIYEPVAFSHALQWIRDRSCVSKNVSINERQLNQKDLDAIAARFKTTKTRYFHLVARLTRLVPGGKPRHYARHCFEYIDRLLIPFLKHFSGAVVIEAKGLKSPTEKTSPNPVSRLSARETSANSPAP